MRWVGCSAGVGLVCVVVRGIGVGGGRPEPARECPHPNPPHTTGLLGLVARVFWGNTQHTCTLFVRVCMLALWRSTLTTIPRPRHMVAQAWTPMAAHGPLRLPAQPNHAGP
jgi:hypothetical protein